MYKSVNLNQNLVVTHPLNPIYNKNAKILILGSFPSIKSRINNFYYGHPQNRFWDVIAYSCLKNTNQINQQKISSKSSIEEKTKFLLDNNIALWDVINSCTITGSSDSSIRNVIPVNINQVFDTANIQAVFTNGGMATKLYKKYLEIITGIEPIQLPSTSPANARYSLEELQCIWYRKLSLFYNFK